MTATNRGQQPAMARTLAMAACLLAARTAQGQSVEAPSRENFLRREGHTVAVLGEHLYIEGGELSQMADGRRVGSWSEPTNTTLAIPLAKSWTTRDVAFESIPHGDDAPYTRMGALWAGTDNKTLYGWGGTNPYNVINEGSIKTRLRVFTKSSDDGAAGTWRNEPPDPNILRTQVGASTSCNGAGLAMSGMGSLWSDSRVPPLYGYRDVLATTRAVQGLVIYSMDSRTWSNETQDESSGFRVPFGPRRRAGVDDGAAVCLGGGIGEKVGTNGRGVAFFLGGTQGEVVEGKNPQPIDFGVVNLYDVATRTMHSQTTTGDRPEGTVAGHCAVVAGGGSRGSYEIFVSGGRGRSPGEVYILTVPGFRWFKAPQGAVDDSDRWRHRCAVAGRGGRQMIAVGGLPSRAQDPFGSRDPWANGLKVLDMTSLTWGDSYNADAPAYEAPEMVRKWYSESYPGRDAFKWDRDETKALFAQMPAITNNNGGSSSQPQDGSGPGGSSTSSSVPLGAIIGGAVGGVVALAAVAAAVWWFCFRRRKQAQQDPQDHESSAGETSAALGQAHAAMWENKAGGTGGSNGDNKSPLAEAHSEVSPSMLGGTSPSMLENTSPSVLDAGSPRVYHEMSGDMYHGHEMPSPPPALEMPTHEARPQELGPGPGVKFDSFRQR
ncbi:hypothetical protein RB594_009895 [Gaeumannomyces avenae]